MTMKKMSNMMKFLAVLFCSYNKYDYICHVVNTIGLSNND